MRFLRGAMIATVLLGCNEDAIGPEQQIDELSSAQGEKSDGASAEALADDDNIRPTRGFYVLGFPNGMSVPIGTTALTEIQKLSLPAGKYIANASAVLATNEAEPRSANCTFTINGGQVGELGMGMVGGTGRGDFLSLPLTIGFTLDAPGDLGISCITDAPENVVFSQASPITAIRLDRLTVQQL